MRRLKQLNLNTCSYTFLTFLIMAELTSQLGVLFIGIAKLATPFVLIDLIRNGFLIETTAALVLSLLIEFSCYGILKKGFARYVSLIVLAGLLGLALILIKQLSFCNFSFTSNSID